MTAFSSGVDQHIAPELASSALVVIDTQVDFVDGGASPIAGTTQVRASHPHKNAAHGWAALLLNERLEVRISGPRRLLYWPS